MIMCLLMDRSLNGQTCGFIGAVNKLISNYGFIQSDILCKLFSFYCSFYGSQL